MTFVNGAVWLPLLAAFLHPILGWFVQQGAQRGSSLTMTVVVANFITALIFFCYLDPMGPWALSGKDWLAIGNGVLFFFGQWFSIRSVKSGDIAVHSSALGLKVIIVGVFSMVVGLEPSSWNLVSGVLLATFAVFLVSGGSAEGWRIHRATVGLTLIACVFFGINDFMTGWLSREVGTARWLTLMLGASGTISFGLLIKQRKEAAVLLRSRAAGGFMLAAGLVMGVQALLVNLAFSGYGQPTLSNVVYSSRGVMAVIFLYLIGKKSDPRFIKKQTWGAVLMIVALAIVLRP